MRETLILLPGWGFDGAALQQAVAKATGGGADIEGVCVAHFDREVVEGEVEFFAATRDEAVGFEQSQRVTLLHVLRGFAC